MNIFIDHQIGPTPAGIVLWLICSYAHAYQTTQNWSPELLVYGDMGRHGGAESLPALIEEVASSNYAAILHIGDFAYDLDSQGGVVRDKINLCYIYMAPNEKGGAIYVKGYMQLTSLQYIGLVYSTSLQYIRLVYSTLACSM